MPRKDGAYLGSVCDIETLRGRCVVDKHTECWHFRSPRGRPMTKDRAQTVWVFGRGKMTVTRAAWLLRTKRLPSKGQVVHRTCESFDCANPWHMTCGTVQQAIQSGFRRGFFNTESRAAATRVFCQAQRKLTEEMLAWMLESPQTGADIAHAFDVSASRVRFLRRRFQLLQQLSSPFSASSAMPGVRPPAEPITQPQEACEAC